MSFQWICAASSCWHRSMTFCWFISLFSACKKIPNNTLLCLFIALYSTSQILLELHATKYSKGDLVTFFRLPVRLSALDVDSNWKWFFIHRIIYCLCASRRECVFSILFCWTQWTLLVLRLCTITLATSCHVDFDYYSLLQVPPCYLYIFILLSSCLCAVFSTRIYYSVNY